MNVPLFVLLSGERIVSHGAPFEGVQVQPINVVTVTEFVSRPAPCDALFVASAKVQGAPPCTTVKSIPAALTNPVRESAVGFASTR